MKRTKKRGKYFFKPCITAVTLSAVVLSGIPVQGLSGIVKTASAAGTPAEREDNTIVYFVDCGDYNVTTVSEGDQFGTHNSVTDQIYGKDPVTGYAWGIDDTISTPAVNGSSNTGGVDTDWTWPYESNTADGVPCFNTFHLTAIPRTSLRKVLKQGIWTINLKLKMVHIILRQVLQTRGDAQKNQQFT